MAMVKHKKLKEWVAAGLMTDAQADAIHAYEEHRKSGRFGRGLIGLSLFAIVIGILSIIAANWYAIPGQVKIGAHVLLNIAVGWVAFQACKRGNDLWREGASLAFLGLTFTLIILIGQIFQLNGSAAAAASFWLVITLPFFLLMGRGYMTAVPWMLAFLATVFFVVSENLESIPDEYRLSMTTGIGVLLPLALMGDGTIALFQRLRPALTDVALKTGVVLSAITASMTLAFWEFYHLDFLSPQRQVQITHILIIMAAGLSAIAVHSFLHNRYRDNPAFKAGAIFAAVGVMAALLPMIVSIGGAKIVPALAFIAYWVFVGWLAQGLNKMRIVSLAITIIAIRIFIVYVELFGSLMDTGLGLIVGGVVMLSLIYAARRLNSRITKKGVPA